MSKLAFVRLSEVHLWERNPRTGTVNNETEEILTLIQNQKTKKGNKLISLAKSLIHHGFYEAIGILKYKDGFMVVKEGNRRISCLKLLKNPEIIAEHFPEIYQEFKSLKKNVKTELFNSIPARIFNEDENEDLEKWIELRHNGLQDGEGLDKWGSYEKENWNSYRGRNTPLLDFHDYLISENILSKEEINSVSKTNWERILGTVGRAYLGIASEDKKYVIKVSLKDFRNRIIKTVQALCGKSVAAVYDNDSIVMFFNGLKFEESEVNDVELHNTVLPMKENEPYDIESHSSETEICEDMLETNLGVKEVNSDKTENTEVYGNSKDKASNANDTDANDTKTAHRQSKPAPFLSNLSCNLQSSQDTDGIIRLSDELRKMSRFKLYKDYPIASASLMRNLLEQCLIYYLKKRNKWNKFCNSKRNDPTLTEIIKNYVADTDIFAQDRKIERLFCIITETPGLKELLNMIVHHPEQFAVTPDLLDTISQAGYFPLVQYLIDYK